MKRSDIKVSVIIPNYNHAQYLKQRIDTVLNQTYANFDVILLDDSSTDGSRAIIDSYQAHPAVVSLELNERNTGSPFLQWKKGIELAKGEWIWIAESDDYADERFLETLISALDGKQNVGLVYCDSKIVSKNIVSGETFGTLKNKRFKTNRWSDDYSNNGKNEIENYLLPGGTINNTSAVLFNAGILKKVNPFDIGLKYIGDKYAFIKVLAGSNVVYVAQGLNYFRDPFNNKYEDKYVHYFYEQFLVFDWVFRNVEIKYRTKFFEGFHDNTQNSLFRNWNKTKLLLYCKLFQLNRYLLLKSILHNFWRAIKLIFKRFDRPGFGNKRKIHL